MKQEETNQTHETTASDASYSSSLDPEEHAPTDMISEAISEIVDNIQEAFQEHDENEA
jgi:hypothetical protein